MRRRLSALALLAAATVGASAAGAQSQPRPVSLAQWQADLATARDLAAGDLDDPGVLATIVDLTGPVVLEVHGATVSLPADPVLKSLSDADPPDRSTALERLAVLAAEAAALAERDVVDRDVLAADLVDIYTDVNPEVSLRRRLERLFNDLLSRVATSVASRPWLAFGLLLLAAAGGIALAVWVGRRSGLVGDVVVPRPDEATERRDWLAEAQAAAAAGDHDRAVRSAYRALVDALGDRGVVDPRPRLTAAECRRAVLLDAPELAAEVDDATRAYEQVVYAGRAPEPDDVAVLLDARAAAVPSGRPRRRSRP